MTINWDNKKPVMAAVKEDGCDLKYASDRLRDELEN